MLGDYITQTGYMAANKLTDPRVRAAHVSIYVLGFVLPVMLQKVSFSRKTAFILSLWLSHYITDSKRWASGEEWPPKPILVDQTIHALSLALLKRLIRG